VTGTVPGAASAPGKENERPYNYNDSILYTVTTVYYIYSDSSILYIVMVWYLLIAVVTVAADGSAVEVEADAGVLTEDSVTMVEVSVLP